jgi:hypothetical protein
MTLVHDSIAFHNVAELEPVPGLGGGLRLQRFHPAVRFIDGREILSGYSSLHTDLVHPSDEGHLAMGANLAALIAPTLNP